MCNSSLDKRNVQYRECDKNGLTSSSSLSPEHLPETNHPNPDNQLHHNANKSTVIIPNTLDKKLRGTSSIIKTLSMGNYSS